MLNCLKNIALISSCFFLWSCNSSERSPLKADLIRQLLDSLYHAKVFNGAIVVAEGDSIIFSRGYGYANFEDSIPFTVNTTSDGGSLAKTFTVIALRRMAEAGLINLDDEVTKSI
jgi:CubicO group peptidase (beta-lactamase class C family)